MGTQRTLATHRLPKSHACRAPQWPRRLATGPSLSLSPPQWNRHHVPCVDNIEPYISSCNHQQHKKESFFTLQPCLLGTVFITHRRAHMRACSLHRHAYMRTYSLHRRAYMCAFTLHRCASVRTCFLHSRALTCACSPYRRAQVSACQTHRHALVRSYSTHRCALWEHLKFSLSRTHARIFGVQARTYARLSPNHPRMWGPHPLNTPVRPSVQTLPKN
jgi:hypothetical protein